MLKNRTRARWIILACGAAALLAGLAAWNQVSQAQLTRSMDGQKAFEVKRVRGPYEMKNIRGIVPIEDKTGCYAVWNEDRVEVYRAGWTETGQFDVAQIWGENFDDVRNVVPVGDNTGAFVVQMKNSHIVFKADWFATH